MISRSPDGSTRRSRDLPEIMTKLSEILNHMGWKTNKYTKAKYCIDADTTVFSIEFTTRV